MNQLSLEKRTQIISLIVEGNSIRATERITGCTKKAITRLIVEVGKACIGFHNETVQGIASKRIECDEMWSFVYSKQKNVPIEKHGEAGDVWTWIGMDSDTKLVISWFVGSRDAEAANCLIQDIAARLITRVQLTTDGLRLYVKAVENAFELGGVDYAQLVKLYGAEPEGKTVNERKYSPNECTGIRKKRILGNPKMKDVSTSYIERQNLTIRMHSRRFTRLTNAFSKKLENHCCAIALHFVYYNFVRIHQTLRVPPAMEAGLIRELWTVRDIVKLIDRKENAEAA